MLDIGDNAADFALQDQFGAISTLDRWVADGQLLLFFYPMDFSPVCTAEACAFRDRHEEWSDVGAQVVGISPQSVDTHQRFADSFSIPFPLLSDPRKEAVRSYGVNGPFGVGVRRVSFLIDSSKTITDRVVSDLFVRRHTDLLTRIIR